jgi:hypothetical protein
VVRPLFEARTRFSDESTGYTKFRTPSHQTVYAALSQYVSQTYPKLGTKIFISIQYEHFLANLTTQQQELGTLRDSDDVIALSSYPYALGLVPLETGRCTKTPVSGQTNRYTVTCSPVQPDYYASAITFANGKPLAFAESGYPGQNFTTTQLISPPGDTLDFMFDESGQSQDVANLLAFAQANELLYFNWTFTKDFGSQVAAESDPTKKAILSFFAWDGITQENSTPRMALSTWDEVLLRPYQAP